MRYPFTILFFIFSFCFGFGQNLVSNSSFESNGQLNCASWYDGCHQELTYLCDTLLPGNPCDIAFYKDTPPEGGVWSLGATGIGNGVPATANAYVTGQSGTNLYQLNLWMKDPEQAFGGAHIGTLSNGKYTESKTVPAESEVWAFYSVLDTLKLQSTDSIQISLSAFAGGPAFGNIYFDKVELFLLDSLTSIANIDHPSNFVSVYPNPAIQYITLDIQDLNKEHTIYLYNITGQVIQTLLTSDQSVTLNMKSWGSGLYFYRVERTKEKRPIDQGKFIVQ
ncbi:MAG TPA: T9SS type A sorting domain-containing protein [Saprospiraceae bacterium]|nr:T9SS type A sorting domain-containing protein [Saprospiraceae bacterium]